MPPKRGKVPPLQLYLWDRGESFPNFRDMSMMIVHIRQAASEVSIRVTSRFRKLRASQQGWARRPARRAPRTAAGIGRQRPLATHLFTVPSS